MQTPSHRARMLLAAGPLAFLAPAVGIAEAGKEVY